jgi:hypothetical protein
MSLVAPSRTALIRRRSVSTWILLSILLVAVPATAQRFSLHGGPSPTAPPFASPTIGVGPPAIDDTDILSPGSLGIPPTVFATGVALGFPAPGFPSGADDLDAFTYGGPVLSLTMVHFSVDWFAAGTPGTPPDVMTELFAAQAPADIFTSPLGPPINPLVINQDALGLIPPIPAGTPFLGFANDNIDGLDLSTAAPGAGFPLYSVQAANTFGVSGADLLAPGMGVVIGAAMLGLLPTDDIDAVHLDTLTGDILFSLTPGSPSLGTIPNPACIAPPPMPGSCSAADIFVAPGGVGPFVVMIPAPAMGLVPIPPGVGGGDDIDALAFPPAPSVPSFPVPALGFVLMFGMLTIGFGVLQARRVPVRR